MRRYKRKEVSVTHNGCISTVDWISHRFPQGTISQPSLLVFFLDPCGKNGLHVCSIGFVDLSHIIICQCVSVVYTKVIDGSITQKSVHEHVLEELLSIAHNVLPWSRCKIVSLHLDGRMLGALSSLWLLRGSTSYATLLCIGVRVHGWKIERGGSSRQCLMRSRAWNNRRDRRDVMVLALISS